MSEPSVPTAYAPAPAATRPPRTWPVLALAVGTALGYALFFVLPYYVNHLDRFPLEDVAMGYHDPKGLWPYGTALGLPFGLGSLLTMVFGPFVVFGVLGWVPFQLVDRRRDLGPLGVVVLLLAAAVAAATLVWLGSPMGGALMEWWLD